MNIHRYSGVGLVWVLLWVLSNLSVSSRKFPFIPYYKLFRKKKAAWLPHYDEISFYRLNTLSRDDNKTKFKTESTHILSQAFSGGEREFSFRSQFN